MGLGEENGSNHSAGGASIGKSVTQHGSANNQDENQDQDQMNHLVVFLANGTQQQETANQLIHSPGNEAQQFGGAVIVNAWRGSNCHPRGYTNKILYLLLSSTLLLSLVNIALISLVIKSTKLTKEGLAEGKIAVTDNGILIDALTTISKLMNLDSMQALARRNLEFTSNRPTKLHISNNRGSQILLDGEGEKIEIRADEFRYIDTSSGQVLLASDASDNSVSLAATNIRPNIKSGYLLEGDLETSEIRGRLNHDLELQSRMGSILIKSGGNQKIQSKASFIDLLSHDSFIFRSPKIDFGSSRIRLEKGLVYFDKLADEQKIKSNYLVESFVRQSKGGPDENLILEAAELISFDGWLCHA